MQTIRLRDIMETPPLETPILSTSFLLSNLHCPSCISNIERTLSSLEPCPLSISPSILTSCVNVRHTSSLHVSTIQEALEDSGFEICCITEDGVARYFSSTPSPPQRHLYNPLDEFVDQPNGPWAQKQQGGSKVPPNARHLRECDLCRAEAAPSLSAELLLQRSRPASDPNPLDSATCYKNAEKLSIHEASVCESQVSFSGVAIDRPSDDTDDMWEASLAVSGMTCASCARTITEQLEKLDWIRQAHVNLISNSATVQFVDKRHANDIVEEIEDIGFQAALDKVVNLKPVATTSRAIEIKVGGMFCSHCPGRIVHALDTFGKSLHIDQVPSLQEPVLKISYIPHSPTLSIRTIISALSAADERFDISIHHPPTLEERSRALHAAEQRRILARAVLTIITAIPTFIIGIVFMSLVPSTNSARRYLSQPWTAGISRGQWALFIMASPTYFFAADVFHRRAIKEVYHLWRKGSKTPILRRFYRFGSMNMLMSLGTSIAYISSVAQLIAAGTSQSISMDEGMFYFDSVVFLTMFLLIGRLIEAYSKSRTGDTVSMLGKLRPTEAVLMEKDGSSFTNAATISVDLLEVGDIVRVVNGASPPCDGIIVEGASMFDESSLTGEVKPVKKRINDEAFSGTVNKGAPVSLRMTGVAGNSLMDQIVKTVRDGQTRRAPIEGIADTLTGYFVPLITLIAICTWIIWLSSGLSGALPRDYLEPSSQGWAPWSLQFAIAVFVVACPCGLALAAPTALFVGGGLAAQHGILVKGGGDALEKASRLRCIVFDKTGTLTHGGEPAVTDHQILSINDVGLQMREEDEILSAVKTLEENSSHTVAKALVSFCNARKIQGHLMEDVEEFPGKGISGVVKGKDKGTKVSILIGNEALMAETGVAISDAIGKKLDDWKAQGSSVALVAMKSLSQPSSWHLCVVFAISDAIRPEAPSLISKLQQNGLDVWMISGDNYATASAIGAEVGISTSNIIAGVLPTQKAERIQHLQKSLSARTSSGNELSHQRGLVAMVGDGINDAPALMAADVGIAIGSGSDVAISSAEFVLISSNLNTLLTLLDLSKVVFNRVKFNFVWALIYNLIGVPVAAGVLYPIVSNGKHVRLDPVWASLAMALSSISVVCSSLSLRSKIPGLGFRK
ncbi:MAG: hypothetical protein M1818_003328 [Claussenomyces sp. TS43310]|nr:MAG: hypothetical protein M1818_003328 [Claussenomyces sp. TS43310]